MTYIVNEQTKPVEFLQVPYLADPSIRVHERVTLAAVIYRNRIGKGATVPSLAKATGFDRHTIRDHLQKLETRKPVPRPPRASRTTPVSHRPPRRLRSHQHWRRTGRRAMSTRMTTAGTPVVPTTPNYTHATNGRRTQLSRTGGTIC